MEKLNKLLHKGGRGGVSDGDGAADGAADLELADGQEPDELDDIRALAGNLSGTGTVTKEIGAERLMAWNNVLARFVYRQSCGSQSHARARRAQSKLTI